MQIFIRFLAFSGKLPKDYVAFHLQGNTTAEDLLRAVESAGQSGMFCAANDWPGLPEHVLLASEAHMLRAEEPLREGQLISIIGQMIGG